MSIFRGEDQIDEIKRRLSNLAKGENVYWTVLREIPGAGYPPEPVVEDIQAFAKSNDVNVSVLR